MSSKANEISVDELEGVTGGTYLESADDAKRFLKNGIKVYSDEILGLPVLESKEFAALRVAFALWRGDKGARRGRR